MSTTGGTRRRRPRRDRAREEETVAKSAKRKYSHCQQDDDSQGGKMMRNSVPTLPEDIWSYILSLMPMRDVARSAYFTNTVDHILKKHSGIGVKRFKLLVQYKLDICDYVNSWLQFAVTPGIEELSLWLSRSKPWYNFPCSLFSDRIANSIRYLELGYCAFHPTIDVGSLRNLKRLQLSCVRISGDELACVLSNSLALEQLELTCCLNIISLKMPCLLQRLDYLKVLECRRVQVIESNAPNLSRFYYSGYKVKFSLGESLQVKNLYVCRPNITSYARANLPSSVPNVETLAIASHCEMKDTPLLPTKFLHLKHLTISLSAWTFSPNYDYFSLVSYLDASPLLEVFILAISQECIESESIFESCSHLRQMPEYRHEHLNSATISGFCSGKSLVELTCHIVENTTSLECLTLDTTHGDGRCSGNGSSLCSPASQSVLMESPRTLLAIRRYIEGKIPPGVKLNVVELCRLCTRCDALLR